MDQDEDEIESRAQKIAQALIDEIEASGKDEDPRETIRRVNEIRDFRLRSRVIDILRHGYRRRGDTGPSG